MKLPFILLLLCLATLANAQSTSPFPAYFKLIPGSEESEQKRLELSSDIDTTWHRWRDRGYHFGFNPQLTPMYTTIDGILSTPYMIQVRGNENERNRKRWGYHVFEGYARDDKSRITMLVNKAYGGGSSRSGSLLLQYGVRPL
ncbi:hypothetical protein [Telluribacter humicola]|uniref:hypothetical protein n=1 Tax=Telluribacter humicola TaxID=1720261 RepID=UPI001E5C402B|nr:hypothetical protein [Telluribacter humicola]